VRELKNVVERAAILSGDSSIVRAEHLMIQRRAAKQSAPDAVGEIKIPSTGKLLDEIVAEAVTLTLRSRTDQAAAACLLGIRADAGKEDDPSSGAFARFGGVSRQNAFPLPLSGAAAHLVAEAEAAERAGNRELARIQYDRALRLLRESRAASTILRRIARSHCDDGHLDVALDCLDAALGSAEAHGALSDIAHTKNLAGNLLLTRGDCRRRSRCARAHFPRGRHRRAPARGDGGAEPGVIASMRGDCPPLSSGTRRVS
jgi:tetratricopeptide (TPR) repeat protein